MTRSERDRIGRCDQGRVWPTSWRSREIGALGSRREGAAQRAWLARTVLRDRCAWLLRTRARCAMPGSGSDWPGWPRYSARDKARRWPTWFRHDPAASCARPRRNRRVRKKPMAMIGRSTCPYEEWDGNRIRGRLPDIYRRDRFAPANGMDEGGSARRRAGLTVAVLWPRRGYVTDPALSAQKIAAAAAHCGPVPLSNGAGGGFLTARPRAGDGWRWFRVMPRCV